MTDVQRLEQMQTGFALRYGSLPELWVRAPGRVDLMGSHTDYNEGYVLTLPIDRDTWIAARPRADGWVAIESLNWVAAANLTCRPCRKMLARRGPTT
jgi:galactokinase